MSKSYNSALVNKIISDFQTGKKHQAFDQLKNYINKNPEDEIANYNFAYMAEIIGHIEIAKKYYIKTIKINPRNWRSIFNLYLMHIKNEKYKSALALINNVLQIKPNYQPALRDKALVLFYLKKPDQGLNYIKESLKQNSKDYIALNTYGLINMSMKFYKEAEKIFKIAIELKPNYFPSYNNLGRNYYLIKDREKALYNFKRAHEINPDFQEAINNIANILSETGEYKKAIENYKLALKKGGNKAEILYNIGVAYAYMNSYAEAEKYYKKSRELNPNDENLKKNYSYLLLSLQRYSEAWILHEGRLKLDEFTFKNSYFDNIKQKLWGGEKINNDDKILLIKEQGVGDEIIFSSMYPDLLKSFPNTVIETDPRLISLFKRSFVFNKKVNTFIEYSFYSKSKKEIKKFDKIIYAGSLGIFYRNKLSDFPKKSYLVGDDQIRKKIDLEIKQISTKKRIGIAWRSKRELLGPDKSISLDLLHPILQLNTFSFFNLQYGETKEEINNYKKINNVNIINMEEVDLYNDFESTAALLKNLDLFLTVSNSTAHLSAALGVKTWLIKPKNHAVFHYWNQPSNSTPWYSNVRLFSYLGSWEKTIDEIKKQLIKTFK